MLNTIKAKSLRESGIITEHTSNKIVVCVKNEQDNVGCVTVFLIITVFVPVIILFDHAKLILLAGMAFQVSTVITFLFYLLCLIILILFNYKCYASMMNKVILETFCIQKNHAELFKCEKTYSGDEHLDKYRFDEIDKIIILKRIYSGDCDIYHVFVQVVEKRIPIVSGGFYEKRPALDLAECINQFMNLPPDSIEITHEVI